MELSRGIIRASSFDEEKGAMPRITHDSAAFASDLQVALTDALDTKVVFDRYDDTYEVDNDTLKLTWSIDDQVLQIGSITTHGYQEPLRDVVETIHACADDYGLEVVVRNVRDGAEVFWLNMGYEESGEPGMYRRESM